MAGGSVQRLKTAGASSLMVMERDLTSTQTTNLWLPKVYYANTPLMSQIAPSMRMDSNLPKLNFSMPPILGHGYRLAGATQLRLLLIINCSLMVLVSTGME